MALQNLLGNRIVNRLVQRKQPFGIPGDRFELEADHMARKVVDGARSETRSPSSSDRGADAGPVSGRGHRLRQESLDELGAGFGTDFRQVRIHRDAEAANAADAINARAFTAGRDLYFGRGQYDPHGKSGKMLLAHELTHVLQQGALPSDGVPIMARTSAPEVQGSFLGDAWEGVKTGASAAWEGVKTGASAVWEGVKTGASAAWEGVKTGASAVWEGVKTAGGWAWEALKAIGGWGWNVLKAAGALAWDLVTEAPVRIWRLLKHLGSGFVDLMEGLWDGIKGFAGHMWAALKGVVKWTADGVVGLFSWVWDGLKGGAKWAWKLMQGDVSGFWQGIGDFFGWLGRGAVGLVKWGWEGLVAAAVWAWQGVKGFAIWIGKGFLAGLAWAGRLLAKLLDLVGFGEIMDLIWQIIKFNSRPLSSTEATEAKLVFGETIAYWQVRIDEYSLIAWLGKLFGGKSGGAMAVTTFHSINFSRTIAPTASSRDMAWLIHELGHVWQYEHVGSQYIGEALHAQATTGYVYGVDDNYANNANGAALATARAAGKTLADFNREQQASIAQHYYLRLTSGRGTADWEPYIDDFKNP